MITDSLNGTPNDYTEMVDPYLHYLKVNIE